MDDLVQWLHAQLDEDERIARQALDFVDADWRVDVARNVVLCPLLTSSGRQPTAVTAERWRYPQVGTPGIVPHVAEHDPARVLREIEAKRRIIDQHERYAAERRRMMGGWDPQSDDSPILAALAAVYSDRPGYREEWRP